MLQFNRYRVQQRIEDFMTSLNNDFDKISKAAVNIDTALPTATAALKGQIIYLEKESGVADEAYMCRKLANNTYSWFKLF